MKTKLFLTVSFIAVIFVLCYGLLVTYVEAMKLVGKAYGINVTNLEYLYTSAILMVIFILLLLFIAVLLYLLLSLDLEEDL